MTSRPASGSERDEVFQCNLIQLAWKGVVHQDDGRFVVAAYTFVLFVLLTYITSTLSNNYSQVDKLWSMLPVLYVWMFVTDLRTLLMACLATVWGVRLTYNFHRRGGYHWPPWSGEEDYRWSHVRNGEVLAILRNPIVWNIFNFVFISLSQNIILFLMASPSAVAYTLAVYPTCKSSHYQLTLGWLDVQASCMFLLLVWIEAIADKQQYDFQTEKRRYLQELAKNISQPDATLAPVTSISSTTTASNSSIDSLSSSSSSSSSSRNKMAEYRDGFCQSGLFAIVRKPNYAAEQAIWCTFFFFSVSAGAPYSYNNWSILGGLSLLLLFQGTGWLTERITQRKYPRYQEYMRRVPLYVPYRLLLLTFSDVWNHHKYKKE